VVSLAGEVSSLLRRVSRREKTGEIRRILNCITPWAIPILHARFRKNDMACTVFCQILL
jgi:hypothetical protein